MKKIIGKLSIFALALALLIVSAAFSGAEEADFGIFPGVAQENGTTYVNLFGVITADEWQDVWFDRFAAIVGEEAAADMAAGLQGSVTSELYGEEAAEAFADGGYAFDCWYINGAEKFTFKDDTVTIEKTDGTSETHTYEYLGVYKVGEGETMEYMGQKIDVSFPCDVYKSTDEAGEFNYFFLRDDTMAETWHIEFRYGSDLEALQGYFTGPYAYWLAAGIDEAADEETITNVIELFCLENMDYSSHSEAALNQLADLGFTGRWTADLSAFGDEYADTELYFDLDVSGHGVTYMNGEQTADFEAYAYDNGEKGDGEGIYVAYSNLEYEAEAAMYTFGTDDNGSVVLTLHSDEGDISYIKQDPEAGEAEEETGAISVSTAEELAAINNDLSGDYILTADIDLSGIEWTPIGAFVPSGESGEEQETPDGTAAFTGTFDGQGHTISNLTIDQPEGMALGLFGCAANAEISNFTLENANVGGMLMSGGVVGYAYCTTVSDVTLRGGKITAYTGEMSGEGMYGGIVAAGMGSLITGCTAEAEIILPDGTANAGIVGGGLELTSVVDCAAAGTITAGNNCYGLGGISGCGFGAEEFTDCRAENVVITAGEGSYWIGGITGYAGGFEDESFGIPVTEFSGCETANVTFNAPEDAEGVGEIVGAGFYSEEAAAMGAPFDQPTVYEIRD